MTLFEVSYQYSCQYFIVNIASDAILTVFCFYPSNVLRLFVHLCRCGTMVEAFFDRLTASSVYYCNL